MKFNIKIAFMLKFHYQNVVFMFIGITKFSIKCHSVAIFANSNTKAPSVQMDLVIKKILLVSQVKQFPIN